MTDERGQWPHRWPPDWWIVPVLLVMQLTVLSGFLYVGWLIFR